MKTSIFLFLIFASSEVKAQFSESFFEHLLLSENSYAPFENRGHYFGTEITNGALAVCFADSGDTEVQWVKLDLQGNYELFSSDLPSGYISPDERILELFENGTNQFIVTRSIDTAYQHQSGIRIHKYTNYSQYDTTFFMPGTLKNSHFQSYFYSGKIYVFFTGNNTGLMRIIINPNTMNLESTMYVGDMSFANVHPYDITKPFFVLFQDAANMHIYNALYGYLTHIRIENDVPQPIDTLAFGVLKIFGINLSKNQLVCLESSSIYRVKKYQIMNDSISKITLVDSLDLPMSCSFPNNLKEYFCISEGSKDFFIHKNTFFEFENNQLVNQKCTPRQYLYSNFDNLNGKVLLFGAREVEKSFHFYPQEWLDPLIISWGELTDLCEFKEYADVFSFGKSDIRFGLGSYFLRVAVRKEDYETCRFKHLIYASSAHFVGKSAGVLYGLEGDSLGYYYKPGPYTFVHQYDQEMMYQYNESFYVDLDMLKNHVMAIKTNQAGYKIPKGILNWPAHGDVSKGQAANLAAFIDLNSNGTYEPLLGEYPSFPGSRCLMNITHQHETDGDNKGLGLEIHSYMYNFDCSDSLDDVLFLKMEVYNRGSRDFDSLSSGIHTDVDLGNYNDDYVGTHVETGMIYAYNGDLLDEANTADPGFQDSLPTIGNMFLKGVKFEANGMDDKIGVSEYQTVNGFGFDDKFIDNEYKGLEYSFHFNASTAETMSDPRKPEEFFNYMNGKLRFGDSLFYGNILVPKIFPARYAFPGNSDPLHYGTYGVDPGFAWSEDSDGNQPGDRRFFGSFGSCALKSGESVTYHSAFLNSKRIPGMGQAQLDLFAKAKHIKAAFNKNKTSCGQTFDNLDESMITQNIPVDSLLGAKIYPNPTSDQFIIDFPVTYQHAEFALFDISGMLLLKQKIENELTTVNLAAYKSGIYILKIQTDFSSQTLMVIKN